MTSLRSMENDGSRFNDTCCNDGTSHVGGCLKAEAGSEHDFVCFFDFFFSRAIYNLTLPLKDIIRMGQLILMSSCTYCT